MVKIIGEFWAQLTEGDGNFNMFAFLEREGAQVHVESIGGWITYLLYQSRNGMQAKKGLDAPYPDARWWEWEAAGQRVEYRRKWLLVALSEALWSTTMREPPATWAGSRLVCSAERTGAPGASFLPLAGARRRRTSRSGQERLLHHSRSVTWCWR